MKSNGSTRGGRRVGSGRKKGSLTRRTQELLAAAANEGETPLEYMLRVMRCSTEDARRRDAMAIAAAPFVHPKLAAVEHSGDKENPLAISVVSGVPRDAVPEESPAPVNGHASH